MSSPTALRHVIRFPTPPASARRSRRLRFGLLALAFALAADPVAASSLYLNELSTASQGNAGVGRGAWAPDASVAIHNPASMTRLDDHGFAAGLSLVVGRVHFDRSRRIDCAARAPLGMVAPSRRWLLQT